eukprot:jgi/Galph1/3027/GphlegSOOS_G1685.1
MRAVIQRVSQASVSGGGKVASIQQGFCILLGIAVTDTEEDLDVIVQKTLQLRAFPDEKDEERWKRNVMDVQGEILLVSQFTLHAAYKSNGRVSFHRSLEPEKSREMFNLAVEKFQKRYRENAVKVCVFGSYMNVSLVNEGPVTFIIDSKDPKRHRRKTKNTAKEAVEENWSYDPSTYDFFVELKSEWPCLTFDFRGESSTRSQYPLSFTFLSGTQADKPHKNQILLGRVSNICKRGDRQESDSEDISDDEEHSQRQSFQASVWKHNGAVNRIRAFPQADSPVAALWSDIGNVEFLNTKDMSLALSEQGVTKRKDWVPTLDSFQDPSGEGFALSWSTCSPGHLVCGNIAGNIRWWQPTDANCSHFSLDSNPFEGHTHSVEDLQWSPVEPSVFVSCSVDRSIRFWDTRLGKRPALVMENAHATDINVLSWNSIDTHLLVSGGDEGMFQVWDLRTLSSTTSPMQASTTPVAQFHFHKGPIVAIEWSPLESSSLVCASADGKISFWDLSLEADDDEQTEQLMNIEEKEQWKNIPPQLLFLHEGQQDPKDVHWHPEIDTLIMSTGANGFHIFKPENIS